MKNIDRIIMRFLVSFVVGKYGVFCAQQIVERGDCEGRHLVRSKKCRNWRRLRTCCEHNTAL